MKNVLWFAVAIIPILFLVIMQRRQTAFAIRPEALRHKLDHNEPVTLIDVRNPDEFNGPPGRIREAVLKPLNHIETWRHELTDSDTPIIVCLSGMRSASAVRRLRANGVNARNLSGGMIAWCKHGYSVY